MINRRISASGKIDNKEWLTEQYVTLGKKVTQIACEIEISPARVHDWINYFQIPLQYKGHPRANIKLENCDWLREQYSVHGRAIQSIADEIGVDDSTVNIWLRKHGIPVRSILRTGPFKNGDWLYDQYWNKQKSQNKIASEQGVAVYTINRWMRIFNIPARSYVDATAGDKNPRWLGGKSFEPYCAAFTKKIKEEVRNAFERKCFLCGIPENGKRLDVHHVDYNKSQGCAGLRWSLIPLCHSCHRKTTVHRFHYYTMLRDYWIYAHMDFDNNRWIE